MRGMVGSGPFIWGVSLSLLCLAWASPVRAEQSAAPTHKTALTARHESPKIAKADHVKPQPASHAAHRVVEPKKLAAHHPNLPGKKAAPPARTIAQASRQAAPRPAARCMKTR